MTDGRSRTFSFACFPAERIAILTGIFTGPAIAVALLLHLRGVIETARGSPGMALGTEAVSRVLPGLTMLGALVLVVFGIVYLQYRAGTRLTVDDHGLRFIRAPTLPFGWLARSVEREWKEIAGADFRQRLGLSGRRPELVIEWVGGRLVLSVADAWEEGDRRRPWLPKPPDDPRGWRAHPLVEAVLEEIDRG